LILDELDEQGYSPFKKCEKQTYKFYFSKKHYLKNDRINRIAG